MKTFFKKIICLSILIFILPACSSTFPEKLSQAKQYHDEKNFIACIDNLTLALPLWKEEDGRILKAEGYQLLGKSYHALGQIEKAADAYRSAVKTATNTYESAYTLGIIYLTSNQNQLAQEAFRTALKLKPFDSQALIGLGNVYYGMGQYAAAKENYELILDHSPGVRDALHFISLADQKLAKRYKTSLKNKKTRNKRR